MSVDHELPSQSWNHFTDLGVATARFAHDLGDPVAVLAMRCQALLWQADRSPETPISSLQDALRDMREAVSQLQSRLGGLRVHFRSQPLEARAVDFGKMVAGVVGSWENLLRARRIDISVDAPEVLPPIAGDAALLRRLFEHLLKNAAEAIGAEGGSIRFEGRPEPPGKVRISVLDTGRGLPATQDVFALFPPDSTAAGPGLAICREIVAAHEGEISCSPNRPSGAIFQVDLPAWDAVARTA